MFSFQSPVMVDFFGPFDSLTNYKLEPNLCCEYSLLANTFGSPGCKRSYFEDDFNNKFDNLFYENLKSYKRKPEVKSLKIINSKTYENENEIIYELDYICRKPSDIKIKVSKDKYLHLTTIDNYEWKIKIPSSVKLEEISSLIQNYIIIKMPKIKSQEIDVKNSDDSKDVNKNENKEIEIDDPDEPIVNDIYED